MKPYTINKYPDGSSYVEVSTEKVLAPSFEFRINSYEDLWHLNQIVDAYNSIGRVPFVTIPCLIDAQADRRFSKNQSFGLKLVCDFLKRMDATFDVFHPHNKDVLEMALGHKVTFKSNHDFLKEVLNKVTSNYMDIDLERSTIILSPDAGAYKWVVDSCDSVGFRGEVASASKHRNWTGSGSELSQYIDRQDFGAKDVIILDDLCIYGGTFLGLAKILKERNVGRLFLAVSHMTVQRPNPELFKVFTRVFTTNSKFNNYYVPQGDGGVQPENLSVIKLFEV
jgi:ribose-phosphate pyrophosphokinase